MHKSNWNEVSWIQMYADASDRSWTPKSNLNSVIIKRNLLYVAMCVVNPFYSRASVHHWPMYRSSHGHIFWWIYSSDVWQFRRQPSPVTHRNLRVCRCLLFLWHNKVELISNLSYRLQHKLFWDKNEDIREQTMLSYLYSSFVDRFSDDIEYMTGTRPNIFWKICWMLVTPVAMLVILIASIVLMSQGKASYYAWNKEMVSKL